MSLVLNDFNIHIATVNGSGSQSANNILVKALFRMGLPVGGKNLFPSNIAGLPTWFTIRVHPQNFTSRRYPYDIVISLNPSTFIADQQTVQSNGYFFYDQDFKTLPTAVRDDVKVVAIPFRELAMDLSESVKLRKLLQNVIYVGILAELLQIPQEILSQVVRDQFKDKNSVVAANLQALTKGRTYAQDHLKDLDFRFCTQACPDQNKDKILIDGNSAAALGLLCGGCTVAAWYPITPSSSLIETFERLSHSVRKNQYGKNNVAVVQAEDEISAICMVLGAGWAGARAMTATSGPGFSLMSEAAGLSYYAEIPAVIWNVQRVGPSTGLPTRTMQGDISSAAQLSHGDTCHVVLSPGSVDECFEFGQTAFDLAERLQTLVIVLTDLDLGMNLHCSQTFKFPERPFDRGKVLSIEDLDRQPEFARYRDLAGDGVAARTLPGTQHPRAAYFTRGTGHDEFAMYSEDPGVYQKNMQRLKRKYQTAKELVPKPIEDIDPLAKVGLIAFGSSHAGMPELRKLLLEDNIRTSYLRLRALPLTAECERFLERWDRVYVVEQNRDGQMLGLLVQAFPLYAQKLRSVVQFDGQPFTSQIFAEAILSAETRV